MPCSVATVFNDGMQSKGTKVKVSSNQKVYKLGVAKPPPSWPVGNGGLGWNSPKKNGNNRGVDWNPGRGPHPRYKYICCRYSYIHMYLIVLEIVKHTTNMSVDNTIIYIYTYNIIYYVYHMYIIYIYYIYILYIYYIYIIYYIIYII